MNEKGDLLRDCIFARVFRGIPLLRRGDLFLHRYSNSLTNTGEAKLEGQTSPTPLDDSAQRLRSAFQGHDSAYSAAILDISERMLASLSSLTNTIRTVGR
jgi:hypothetical protein